MPAQDAASAAPSSGAAAASAGVLGTAADKAMLTVFNRPIVEFRVTLFGVTPADRAQRARAFITRHLERRADDAITLLPYGGGKAVLVDGARAFWVVPGDVDPASGEEADPDRVVAALKQALAEGREAHDWGALLRALGFAGIGTAVFGVYLWALLRLRRWLQARLFDLGERHRDRLAIRGTALIDRERVYGMARLLTHGLFWLLALAAASEWLGFVMSQFPYTRRWGEGLHDSVIGLVEQMLGSIAASLPGLAVAIVIFLIARGVLSLVKPLFQQVERGELTLNWVDQDTVRPTRNLVNMGVWLFALAMAYPYLPGSETEAFKGISVMLGVMISLGGSNLLGQAIGGLIITYSHTMRIGEYVRVGDVEGTVTEIGTFATRVHTGKGEVLTLPNSLVVGSVTTNYSRTVSDHGYVVDTVLTIGYDAPWRQVHAMMIEAALRTEGIRATPKPHVFQTALSDFYAEYRVVAHATAIDPRPRAEVLTQLHANLQDVFNENGVQIMSPHYLGDPQDAKIVPPSKWNPTIAPRA